MTYYPEGGGESLQLSDPAVTEATLAGLQNNRCYTITVVATAGEHKREGVARTVLLPQQGILNSLQYLTAAASFHGHLWTSTFSWEFVLTMFSNIALFPGLPTVQF